MAASLEQGVTPPDASRRQQPRLTPADADLGVGFAGMTIAMFPLDRHIAAHLRDQATPANPRDFTLGPDFSSEDRSALPRVT
ncbi:MAG: hypothetical protein M3Z05_21390 [Gemmatimonadota bacterium]|nr:hypothetical protein [Gemmatimonadota bacterium]